MKTRKILRIGRGEEVKIVEEEAPAQTDGKERSRMLHVLSIASQLGFSISLPIAGGAFLGQLLDAKFNTAPRMTLSFIFFGLFIGGANIYFIVRETREK